MHMSLIACIKIPSAFLGSVYVVDFYGPQEGRTLQKCYSLRTLPNLSPTEITLSSVLVRTRASLCVKISVRLNVLH